MTQKLEEAKRLYQTSNADQKYVLEKLFPELAESEEERIRKAIIATIHLYYGEPLEDEAKEMIAWLEKQGEQKPAWSEEDERLRHSCIAHIEDELEQIRNDKYGHSEIISDLKESCRERIKWLKSLKDRYTWKPSDEQMEALKGVQEGVFRLGILESLYNDLKKLREE